MPRRFSSRNNQQEIHEGKLYEYFPCGSSRIDSMILHLIIFVVTLGIAALSDVH
jgi:hypothetical protein